MGGFVVVDRNLLRCGDVVNLARMSDEGGDSCKSINSGDDPSYSVLRCQVGKSWGKRVFTERENCEKKEEKKRKGRELH